MADCRVPIFFLLFIDGFAGKAIGTYLNTSAFKILQKLEPVVMRYSEKTLTTYQKENLKYVFRCLSLCNL